MSLSKNQIKLITSLQQKKSRQKYKLFIAEGVKVVNELLNSSFELDTLYATSEYKANVDRNKCIEISQNELEKISFLKSPNKVIALFKIPDTELTTDQNSLIVALDSINDPGNLGTIIRLCDWFGITSIICSETTVDCFNPKVVQATMGSLTRVSIQYTNLYDYISNSPLQVYAADMKGQNVYTTNLEQNAILVMGNEANGISTPIMELIKNKISIPQFGKIHETESLNVATATAIILSEFKRR